MSSYDFLKEKAAFEEWWATSDRAKDMRDLGNGSTIKGMLLTVAKFCAKWAWIERAKRDR